MTRTNTLYENHYTTKHAFSFGKNWKQYLATLNDEKIAEACASLKHWLGDLSGKTFLDIGCGSGLFSLAAWKQGAFVTSVDIDTASLDCARYLREKDTMQETPAKQGRGAEKKWKITHGSILNTTFTNTLGQHDIVYSWGVLHHTGNMYAAFENTAKLVKPGGLLFIAIYNTNTTYRLEGTSKTWLWLKKMYNKSPAFVKKVMFGTYTLYLWLGLLAHGQNPRTYVHSYKSFRGMDFYSDIRDWLGGYPYEHATPHEVISWFEKKGFVLKKQKQARSLGCNEFLFRKNKEASD